jgi:hypothetical protein
MQGPKDSVAPCFNVLFVCVGNPCRSRMRRRWRTVWGKGPCVLEVPDRDPLA